MLVDPFTRSRFAGQHIVGDYDWPPAHDHGIPSLSTVLNETESTRVVDELARRRIEYDCHEEGKHTGNWRVTVQGPVAVSQLYSGLNADNWSKKILQSTVGSTKVQGGLLFHARNIHDTYRDFQLELLTEALEIQKIRYEKLSDSMLIVNDEESLGRARSIVGHAQNKSFVRRV